MSICGEYLTRFWTKMGGLPLLKVVPFVLAVVTILSHAVRCQQQCKGQLKSILVPNYAQGVSGTAVNVVFSSSGQNYTMNCGNRIPYQAIIKPPTVQSSKFNKKYVALMLFDRDGGFNGVACANTSGQLLPGSQGKSGSSSDDTVHLLWMVFNIKKSDLRQSRLGNADVSVPYILPSKLDATRPDDHRITILLLSQRGKIDDTLFTGNLRCFRPKSYAAGKNLQTPSQAQYSIIDVNLVHAAVGSL